MIVITVIFAKGDGHLDHIACCGHLAAVGEAGCIAKRRTRHANATRFRRHHLRKFDFRTTKVFGDNHGNVICRFGHKGQNRVFDRNAFTWLKTKLGRRLSPCTLGYFHRCRKRYLAVVECIKQHIKRHDLGQRRWIHFVIGAVFMKNFASVTINDHCRIRSGNGTCRRKNSRTQKHRQAHKCDGKATHAVTAARRS